MLAFVWERKFFGGVMAEQDVVDAFAEMLEHPSQRLVFEIVDEGVKYRVMHTQYLGVRVTISFIIYEKDEMSPVVLCTFQEGWLEEPAVLQKIKTSRASLS